MRVSPALGLLAFLGCLTAPIHAQTAPSKTFISDDKDFRFTYPSDFRICYAGDSRCICDRDALVCVMYPNTYEGTRFQYASFQVKIIRRSGGAQQCVTPAPTTAGTIEPYPEFFISPTRPGEMIGGVMFVHGERAGAALGTVATFDYYRSYRKSATQPYAGTCYQLMITSAWSNVTADPGVYQEFTHADAEKVERAMSEVLHSFRFAGVKAQP